MKYTKVIVTIFAMFIFYVIYLLFIATTHEIFDLSTLDPNDNKNIDIRVYLAKDKPIQIDPAQNISIFYIKDKNAKLYKVQGPADVPAGFQDAEIVILRGHLHHDYFHASSIVGIE